MVARNPPILPACHKEMERFLGQCFSNYFNRFEFLERSNMLGFIMRKYNRRSCPGGKNQRKTKAFSIFAETLVSANCHIAQRRKCLCKMKCEHIHLYVLRQNVRLVYLPTKDKTMSTVAPNCTARRLPILVTAIVCTFSVNVVAPVPVPHRPAKAQVRPSRPILRLTTPGVGALAATKSDVAWYDPT